MPLLNLNAEATNLKNVLGATISINDSVLKKSDRVPFLFTSTRRLRLINDKFSKFSDITIQDIDPSIKNIPTVQSELPVIQMLINPNTITWKQPKRITKRDTQEGSVFFHFSNARGQNNDILTMDFKGNTGNLNIISDLPPEQAGVGALGATGSSTDALKKLIAWHNLWNLTREAMLLEDNIANEFLITYTSPAIPIEIMLIGFFSRVMDWTDSADKPNTKEYTFSFTVQETIPDLDDIVKDVQTLVADASLTNT